MGKSDGRDRLIFQFHLRFTPYETPFGLMDRFREELRQWLITNDYDYGMGGLGGMVMIYGDVGRRDGDVTLADREQLADWLRRQHVKCNVALGDLEPESTANIRREGAAVVFHVDNLSEEDRTKAKADYESIMKSVNNQSASSSDCR